MSDGKYLVFTLDDAEYAIAVADVREIIGAIPITRVPGVPDSVRGVVNLRGKIIPVADLRIRFNMAAVDHGARTCIIVVRARGGEFGLVVDKVLEVARIAETDIEPPPVFGADVHTDYLIGVARNGNGARLLLDVERTLTTVETAAMSAAAHSA